MPSSLSSVSDDELEILEAIAAEDLLELKMKIKQEKDSDDSGVEYLGTTTRTNDPLMPLSKEAPNKLQVKVETSPKREPTYTIDSHLLNRRANKTPLYLLNPDDFPDDLQKQMRIRRATVTYRHHLQKKELIRWLTKENANLNKIVDIYAERDKAMKEYCECPAVGRIMGNFDPRRSYRIELPPLPELQPLPPIKNPRKTLHQSFNGSKQERPKSTSTDSNSNLATPPRQYSAAENKNTTQKSHEATIQESKFHNFNLVRSYQERLNRMLSPTYQSQKPLPVVEKPPAIVETGNKSVGAILPKSPEVHTILQQKQLKQVLFYPISTTQKPETSAGVNQRQSQPQTEKQILQRSNASAPQKITSALQSLGSFDLDKMKFLPILPASTVFKTVDKPMTPLKSEPLQRKFILLLSPKEEGLRKTSIQGLLCNQTRTSSTEPKENQPIIKGGTTVPHETCKSVTNASHPVGSELKPSTDTSMQIKMFKAQNKTTGDLQKSPVKIVKNNQELEKNGPPNILCRSRTRCQPNAEDTLKVKRPSCDLAATEESNQSDGGFDLTYKPAKKRKH